MRFVVAILLATGLIAAQAAHGGAMEPFLPLPAYALIMLAALAAMPAAVSNLRGPAPSAVVPVLALAGYVVWRCAAHPPDSALASTDFGLALACVAAWGAAAALRDDASRLCWLWLGIAAAMLQIGVALWQMTHEGFSQPWWFSGELKSLYESKFPARARGLFLNPNQFAWLMNAMALLTLSVGAWGRVRPVTRVVVLYFSVVFIAMAVLSASRGGIISLVVGLAVFGLVSLGMVVFVVRRGRRGLILAGALLALVVCGLAGYFAFSSSWLVQGRLGSLAAPDVRGFFFEHAARLFQTEPLFGAGPGVYRYAARLYRNPRQPGDALLAHDDWSQCLAEYGIVGFGLLALVFFAGVGAGVRQFSRYVKAREAVGELTTTRGAFALGASCVLVAFGVHSFTDFNLHIPANALLAATMLGLATAPGPDDGIRRSLWAAAGRGLAATGLLGAAAVLILMLNHDARPQWETLQAQNAAVRGDLDAVLDHTQRVLKQEPDSPLALGLRARALLDYEAWAETRRDAQAESSDKDDDTDEDVEVAPVLPKARQIEMQKEALACSERAAGLQPLERLHRIGIARALAYLDRQADARPAYVDGVRLDINDAYPWTAYGDHLQEQDEDAAALDIYATACWLADSQYAGTQYELLKEDMNPSPDEETEP